MQQETLGSLQSCKETSFCPFKITQSQVLCYSDTKQTMTTDLCKHPNISRGTNQSCPESTDLHIFPVSSLIIWSHHPSHQPSSAGKRGEWGVCWELGNHGLREIKIVHSCQMVTLPARQKWQLLAWVQSIHCSWLPSQWQWYVKMRPLYTAWGFHPTPTVNPGRLKNRIFFA